MSLLPSRCSACLPAHRKKKHGGKRSRPSQDVNLQFNLFSPTFGRRDDRGAATGRNGEKQQRREVWREERDERGKSQ